MKLRIILSLAILIILSLVVWKTVDFGQLVNTLQQFPPLFLFLALVLATFMSVLKTWRMMVLLKSHNIYIPFWTSFKLFLASQAMTPLPGGEASRAILISKETNIPVKDAAIPVLLQALLELFSAVILAILGSLFYHTLLGPGIVALCFLSALVVLLTHSRLLTALLKHGSRFGFIRRNKKSMLEMQQDLQENIFREHSMLPTTSLLQAFGIAILTNFVGGVLLVLIAGGYGEPLSLFKATFVYAGGTAIQGLATISPGGIGFTEGGMIGLLTFFDVSQALPIILIFRFVTFLYYIALGLILIGIFYRKTLMSPSKRKDSQ